MHKVKSHFTNFDLLNTIVSIMCERLLETSVKMFKYFITIALNCVKVVMSFVIVYYLWFPVFLVPIYVLVVWRTILSLIFKVVYRGKYRLMEAADATHTFDSYANVNTITFFVYINGSCDIEKLRSRAKKLILQYSNYSGQQPYWKLMHLARKKLGFICWEDMSDSFNVEHHVRYFPGFNQRNQIYRETDLFEAVAELSCKEWNYTRPKWEFLVIPQLKMENVNVINSVITVRISHEYGDGISIMQMFRHHIFDQPAPKLLFDPVNPPFPRARMYTKLFMYLQAFLFGPSCIMKFLSYKESHNVTCNGSLTGPKYFGRNKAEIPLDIIRTMRKRFRVSTSAIFHSAFCGALRTMLEKRNHAIPAKAIGGMAYGLLPYPNDHLQNHFTPLVDEYAVGIEDPVKRVRNIEKRLRSVVQPYSLITTSLVYKFMGLLPAFAIKAALGVVNILFVVSNVPGLTGDVKFGGYPVELICGSPPSCKGIKYTIGVGCHEEKFLLGFFIEKSAVVQSKLDMNEFIQAFECEVQLLSDKL